MTAVRKNHKSRNDESEEMRIVFYHVMLYFVWKTYKTTEDSEEETNKQTHSFIQIQSWIVFFFRIDKN